jgi:hypothetical protein
MKQLSLNLLTVLLWLGLFSAIVPGLAAQKIDTDWDRRVTDFSQYKTYAWEKPVRTTSNPLMDQRIVAAIDTQLAAKGLRKVESGADLLVTYSAVVRKETSAIATGVGGWRMRGGVGRIDPVTEKTGTLVVDLAAAQSKDLIWRGSAADTLSDKSEKNARKIESAVQKMFRNYPPKAK